MNTEPSVIGPIRSAVPDMLSVTKYALGNKYCAENIQVMIDENTRDDALHTVHGQDPIGNMLQHGHMAVHARR